MKKFLLFPALLISIIGANAQTGNVGVGTTTPQAKLHVAGTARVDSLGNASTDNYVVMAQPNGKMYSTPVANVLSGGGTTSNSNVVYNGAGMDYLDGKVRVLKQTLTQNTFTLNVDDYILAHYISAGGDTAKIILPDPATMPNKLFILKTGSTGYRYNFYTTTGGSQYSQINYTNMTTFKLKSDGVRWLIFYTNPSFQYNYEDIFIGSYVIGPAL